MLKLTLKSHLDHPSGNGARVPRCQAMSKRSGKQCGRIANSGYAVCAMHGAGTKKRVKAGKRKAAGRPPVLDFYTRHGKANIKEAIQAKASPQVLANRRKRIYIFNYSNPQKSSILEALQNLVVHYYRGVNMTHEPDTKRNIAIAKERTERAIAEGKEMTFLYTKKNGEVTSRRILPTVVFENGVGMKAKDLNDGGKEKIFLFAGMWLETDEE